MPYKTERILGSYHFCKGTLQKCKDLLYGPSNPFHFSNLNEILPEELLPNTKPKFEKFFLRWLKKKFSWLSWNFVEWDSVKEIKIKNNRNNCTAPVPLGRASHVRTLAITGTSRRLPQGEKVGRFLCTPSQASSLQCCTHNKKSPFPRNQLSCWWMFVCLFVFM